nr:Chain B, decameric peptide iCAL36 [synthetic construct]3SFJ_D Chain D, decameric peptide iCAL36 [synthetic construct]4E34_C Chain C, decameric peptide, iCAL36 [synthetic construct]4E34_D Chain D, decameric peptide, iCAL36 [synthetic construct]
ANSRWPTSII